MTPVQHILGLAINSLTRLFEFQAEEEAVQITMDDLKLIAWETPLGPYSASGCAS